MTSVADLLTAIAPSPDHVAGLDPRFATALQQMLLAAPENVRAGIRLNSGFRTPERQAQLFQAAVQKYGSEDAARKWVAPPGRSRHNHGHAADLHFGDDAVKAWVHANAGNYGLAFPMSHEPWHVELAGARGAPATATAGQTPSSAQPQGVSSAFTFAGDTLPPFLTLLPRPQQTALPMPESRDPATDPAFQPRRAHRNNNRPFV